MPRVDLKDIAGGILTVRSQDIRAVHRGPGAVLVRLYVVGYGWAVVDAEEEDRVRQLLDDTCEITTEGERPMTTEEKTMSTDREVSPGDVVGY